MIYIAFWQGLLDGNLGLWNKSHKPIMNIPNLNYEMLLYSPLSKIFIHFLWIFFRSCCIHHWVKYSSSNPMRRHLLHILYSLEEVPSMPWTILKVDILQVFLEPS